MGDLRGLLIGSHPQFLNQFSIRRDSESCSLLEIILKFKMDLKLILCIVMISPVFGDNLNIQNANQSPQEPMELDRARSSWNFGGHSPNRKTAASTLAQWGRQRSSIPGSPPLVINRRQGTAPKASTRTHKKSSNPASPAPGGLTMQPRHFKSHPKRVKPGKRTKVNKPATQPQPMNPLSPMITPQQVLPQQSYYSHPFTRQQPAPTNPSWNRGSRMLILPKSDNILNKFRKEDLWHLDKGESYVLKNEDLLYDHFQRNLHLGLPSNGLEEDDSSNEIEPHPQKTHQTKMLEHEAEKLIDSAEDTVCNTNHLTGERNAAPTHIHHHHHYNKEKPAAPAAPTTPAPNRLTIAPLPRIHNPIPLGCLLTIPIFHPIRPRTHTACLLSIPGTPNLLKRRRRSTDDVSVAQEKKSMPAPSTNPQSSQIRQQIFSGNNQRISPLGSRKHYAAHVGNGKNPLPQPPVTSNLKVPATIIAPPHFDKSDLLSMLMGSSGVSPKEMGTVLATNTRYVRFGRGLPNRGATGTRKERKFHWFPDTTKKHIYSKSKHQQQLRQSPSSMNQQPIPSSSNQIYSSVKIPQSSSQKQRPSPISTPSLPQISSMVSQPAPQKINVGTPSQPQPSQQQQHFNVATPPLPMQFNVHISPRGRPSSHIQTVYNLPTSSNQAAIPINPVAQPAYQNVPATISEKPKKHGDNFKYSEYWKPVYKEKPKPQKPFKYEYNPSPSYSSTESKESYNNENEEQTNFAEDSLHSASSMQEPAQSWDDINNLQTFSFALKKNKIPYEVDTSTTGTFSNDNDEDSSFSPTDLIPDNYFTHEPNQQLTEGVDSKSPNEDYYYSIVRQITGDLPDPIIINIPKDQDQGLLNEIKK